MKEINFNSSNQNLVEQIFLGYLKKGYVLKKAYTKKKYFLFGKTVYFVEMEAGLLKYKELIQEALDNEDYLEADKLTKDYDSMKELDFKK